MQSTLLECSSSSSSFAATTRRYINILSYNWTEMNCTIVSIIPKTLRVNQAKRNGWRWCWWWRRKIVASQKKRKKEQKKMIIETRRQWTKWRVLVIYRRTLAKQCRRCQKISVLFQYFRKRIWETPSPAIQIFNEFEWLCAWHSLARGPSVDKVTTVDQQQQQHRPHRWPL